MNTDEKKIETQKNLAKTIQYNGRIRDKKKDSRMATLMYQAYMSWQAGLLPQFAIVDGQ